tara:strand:+ start:14805 stop:15884 length:1080 start_codon:yes stop_codon:yes gene_type:complete
MPQSKLSIAVIPGDGVGREVTPEGLRVLDAVATRSKASFQRTIFDWGTDYYFQYGRMMPDDAVDQLRSFDAILLGAIGHPDVPDNVTLNGLLLPIRRAFDQFACVRPAKLYPGVSSPLSDKSLNSIDMIIVRENTEGEYAQAGGFVYPNLPQEVAVQTSVFTRGGTERIIRYAFELARRTNRRKKVTSITKSNAQGYSMVLWDRVFLDVAADYPDVDTESLLIDAATLHFVHRPESFDVVVGSNLFGDILSDLSAALTGSLGLAPSANLNPSRSLPSMFEPVHGSAPDIAGKEIVNPLAMIFSVAMMVDFWGLSRESQAIENAVAEVLRSGNSQHLTPDLGGHAKTREVTDAVIDRLLV